MALMGLLLPSLDATQPAVASAANGVPQLLHCTGCPFPSSHRKSDLAQPTLKHHATTRQQIEPQKLHVSTTQPPTFNHRKGEYSQSISPTHEELANDRVQDNSLVPDPELGHLRLYEQELASEENTETQNSADGDPELGNLQLRERELATNRQDTDSVFLIGRVDYFNSNNILLDDFDPVNDQIARAGLSLLAVPNLGQHTQLIASISGDVAVYRDLTDLNYNDLEFRAGIRQQLFPRTYGEISWKNSQFFDANTGDRFLNDHSIFLSLSHRAYLAPQLSLDGFYELRLGFSDPSDRSRITNSLGASLNYSVQSNLDVGLDYQFSLTDFTQHSQQDSYHQITAEVSYDLNTNTRISVYGGFSFGQSSDPTIDFNSAVFGAVFDVFVPLF